MTKPSRLASLAALCLALGACNRAGDPATVSLEQSVAAPAAPARMVALAATGAPAQAVATLPAEAGAVASVRVKAYVNGFRQDIALQDIALKDGAARAVANGLVVLVRTSSQTTLDEAVPLYKPTEAAIRSELGAQFPHIPMQVVERPSSNDYGPYGLALGRTGADVRCLYMWQWIDENRIPREARLQGPISVRVRLCHAGTTFDAMAAMVGHLTIAAPTGEAVAVADAASVVVATPRKPRKKRIARHAPRERIAAVVQADVAPQPAYQPAPLAGDLPPQAYLGPKSGAAGKPK